MHFETHSNDCYGSLTITAHPELQKRIIDSLQGTGEEEGNPFDFNKVIPMPDYIFRGNIGPQEKEQYGKNNWYDWSIENWGTKWNSYDTERDGNSFSFYTAWAPCHPVIRALAKKYPDARFEYWYEEPGWGFCGHEIYEHGQAQYLMEADLEENYNDDEDDDPLFEDYEEWREDITITVFDIINGVKRGRIERRENRDDCIRIIKGVFVERINSSTDAAACA